MNLVKIISTSLDSFGKLIVKFSRFGNKDIQTSIEVSQYGVDSNPIKGMVAIYTPTTSNGDTFILGYLNKNRLADVGEFRTFATDADGVEKFYIWQKSDGTCEIGGDTNFAVKFNELKTEFNKLKTDHNNFLAEYKTHTHVLTLTSGTGTAAPTISTQIANTSNIDNSKNDKIKTI